MSAPKAQCGTRSGYMRHLRLKEAPCAECYKSQSDYARERYASNPAAREKKLASSNATNRAMARLRHRHYAEYLALLSEERSR